MIDCPLCGEKGGCYSVPVNEFHNSYLCLGCGFQSSDLMKEGEYDKASFEEQLPELYKDLRTLDSENRAWYPSVVNIEDKGTVFVNGTNKEEWQWSAIKTKKLTLKEKKEPKFKGKEYKSDSKTLTGFGKDYLSALEFIGVEF